MTYAGVLTRAQIVVVLALIALVVTLVAACGEDSIRTEAPPGETPTLSAATVDPEDKEARFYDDFQLLYHIENPVLECRDGASWLSIWNIGNHLGADTVLKASPIIPDVAGFRSLETKVTSSRLASDVIGERGYFDSTSLVTIVEARLPTFLTDSTYPQFSVVLTGTDDQSGMRFTSIGINIETSAARC
ncbi:MAG: hypothetical protein IIC91_06065 [Chloroflexi bacterium]|nr:hypothetical protein [Chloroflexota bacterium]